MTSPGRNILEPFLDRDRRPGQRADVNRKMIGLRDQASSGVADRQREIAAGIEDLRIGGAKHGLAHLFHDRTEPMLDDGTRDGIDPGRHCTPLLLIGQSVAETSLSAPDAASMIASMSASVIGVDNAINPLPAASTPRLRKPRLKAAWCFASPRSDRPSDSRGSAGRRNESSGANRGLRYDLHPVAAKRRVDA